MLPPYWIEERFVARHSITFLCVLCFLWLLLSRFRLEFYDLVVVDDISDEDWAATNVAIFNVCLASHRCIQHHRYLFTAMRTSKKVFHGFCTCVLTYQVGSC